MCSLYIPVCLANTPFAVNLASGRLASELLPTLPALRQPATATRSNPAVLPHRKVEHLWLHMCVSAAMRVIKPKINLCTGV